MCYMYFLFLSFVKNIITVHWIFIFDNVENLIIGYRKRFTNQVNYFIFKRDSF